MIEIFHKDMNNLSATQKAYDTIYHEKGIHQLDSFYLWLIGLLKSKPEDLILDISCGEGRLVNLAQKRGYRVFGVDFSSVGLKIGRQEHTTSIFSVGDGEILPFPTDSIDCITHIGSLEHYHHPMKGIEEIGRILKPGGTAVILLPNAFGLFGNVKYVITHGEVFDDGQPIQRYATRMTWEIMLQKGNLKILKVLPYTEVNFPRVWPDFFWLLARPQRIIRHLISLLVPVNLANHLVYICTKE
jgi:ubiquinone/menaquinone biosynthesis C-methylase UbiE